MAPQQGRAVSDALQQAIDAMREAYDAALDVEFWDINQVWASVLDAVPGDVHARLAIDKGALERCQEAYTVDGRKLYRLAGKDPQP